MTQQKISGIYRITGPNGKMYIGSAVNIDRRWSDHRNGYGSNIHLQRSIKKYGLDSFRFSIIEVVNDVSKLLNTEQKWLNTLFAFVDSGDIETYNIARCATASMLGKKHTEETICKLKGKTKSEEHRRKIGKAAKGRTHTPETKRRLSETGKGRRHTEETKQLMSMRMRGNDHGKNSKRCTGKRYTQDEKDKFALIRSGGKVHSFISPDGIVYENVTNISKFANEHNLNRSALSKLATMRLKSYKKWTLKTQE